MLEGVASTPFVKGIAVVVNDNESKKYDDIPYKSFPFIQTHPGRLATIGTIFGMRPSSPARCRVLEMGCASGGNLLPMAERYPESQFIGLDFSQNAIQRGTELIHKIGLTNIELRHADIRAIDATWGTFDFIIAHGVFSWVPDEVQDKMLAVCQELLTPNGIAYLSYNTNPGWRMRGMIRDVMLFRAQFFRETDDQLREARALVDFLAKSVSTEKNPYGILLNDELKLLQSKEDYYLLHEFLETVNSPLYFYQFVERAEAKGLQYLGEADYSVMSVNNFPTEVANMLKSLSADTVQREQYMDFVRNRLFRQTLLCRQAVKIERNPGPECVFSLHVASDAVPDAPLTEFNARDRVTFTRPGSTMTTREPLMKAAMAHLKEVWPRFVPFGELLANARSRVHSEPVILDTERDEKESRALAEPLLRCFATTHVDLSVHPLAPNLELSEHPAASRLTRAQAEESKVVTNQWHGTFQLTDLQRQVVRQLDGTRDRPAIVEFLIDQVQSGKMMIHEKGIAVKEPERVRPILTKIVEETLLQLSRAGLLTS